MASEPLSKTKRKRAMEELQSLGEALVDLAEPPAFLPEELLQAVREARRMTRRDEARRRQMQYIGRLMRNIDVEPVRAALAKARGDSAAETAKLRRLEQARNRLMEDEKAIGKIAARYPATFIQRLRSLRRAALKEREQGRPPKNFRAIFQLLREMEEQEEHKEAEEARQTSPDFTVQE